MPTKNARVNVVMEKPLYAAVNEIAEERELSMSMVVKDFIREAIELQEDQTLAGFAEIREASLKKALSHEDVWYH
ncbi:MAG: ribbon-helix-helix protein, CopG family [Proteobacteria bacterium]|nr:ribbon-helix-helix protein, CopG family [Pseudomonadota bacterium]